MVERGRRRIRSKTVRNLLTLAHYRFGMVLRHKAREIGAIVLSVLTSATSGHRRLSPGLGSCWKVLAAHQWSSLRTASGWTVTTTGARGIYLRALGDIPARESIAFRVRRERERLVSQRKYER